MNLPRSARKTPSCSVPIHQLVLHLLAEKKVTGLRVDHVDGLYDPVGYLRRLQQAASQAMQYGTVSVKCSLLTTLRARPSRHHKTSVESAPQSDEPPCYVVVEKILSEGRDLARALATTTAQRATTFLRR